MARITGIGGVFLRSRDPKALKQWYADALGAKLSEYGSINFLWSDEGPAGSGLTVFSPFAEDTPYFGDSGQSYMINFRVDDLDGLLAHLSTLGIWIDPKREDAEYGHFAWIKDPEGNRIELWQPVEVSEETKEEFLK